MKGFIIVFYKYKNMNYLKIAQRLDTYGLYSLADRFEKYAEQGLFVPKSATGENLQTMFRQFLLNSIEYVQENRKFICPKCKQLDIDGGFCEYCATQLIANPDFGKRSQKINFYKLNGLVRNSPLAQNISNVIEETDSRRVGGFDRANKTLTIPNKFNSTVDFQQMLQTLFHENIHAFSPLLANTIQNVKNREALRNSIIKLLDDGKITGKEAIARIQAMGELKDLGKQNTRGRTSYFTNEEIMAQTQNIYGAFNKNNLTRVYSKYYKKKPIEFLNDFKKFITDLRYHTNIGNQLEKHPEILRVKNEWKNYYLKVGLSAELAEQFSNVKKMEALKTSYITSLPSSKFIQLVDEITGAETFERLLDIKDPKFFQNFIKYLGNQLLGVEKILNVQKTSLTGAMKNMRPSANTISKLTSKNPAINKPTTPQIIKQTSVILPKIIETFEKLNSVVQKISSTPAGKVLRVGLVAKDIAIILASANKIRNDINEQNELQYKEIYDLGLSIVSLLTDADTVAIVTKLFPPAALLLNNPEVKKWMTIINVSANVLMGLVQGADLLGTVTSGDKNPNEAVLMGILNNPGSLQALAMSLNTLRDKYGEVWNALVDIEKNVPILEAFRKHVALTKTGDYEPYRYSLLYKFIHNKANIVAYQKTPEFNKTKGQLFYPTANSPYAISSYKKARDAKNNAIGNAVPFS
jgi:hypothetical protein